MKTLYLLLIGALGIGIFLIRPADDAISSEAIAPTSSAGRTLTQTEAGFERAMQPKTFVFPDDHGAHDRFKTEWWYFTGNVATAEGRRFGYELTFFRFALKPEPSPSLSTWRSPQLYMAHLAVTDVEGRRFYVEERFSRAGNGLAGADRRHFQVWLQHWSAAAVDGALDFPLRLQAKTQDFAIDLNLTVEKSYVLQGDNGLSQKSREAGNASYYYSYPRLATEGAITVKDHDFPVKGRSWMDREWSTSALSSDQEGWDWFALQLDDSSDVMFYRLRRKDGRDDASSAGSLSLPDNAKIALAFDAVKIEVLSYWQSPHSKISYPARWHLAIPDRQLDLTITPLLNDQELNVSYRYWEGAVAVSGTQAGRPITGYGYVELTGYK